MLSTQLIVMYAIAGAVFWSAFIFIVIKLCQRCARRNQQQTYVAFVQNNQFPNQNPRPVNPVPQYNSGSLNNIYQSQPYQTQIPSPYNPPQNVWGDFNSIPFPSNLARNNQNFNYGNNQPNWERQDRNQRFDDAVPRNDQVEWNVIRTQGDRFNEDHFDNGVSPLIPQRNQGYDNQNNNYTRNF